MIRTYFRPISYAWLSLSFFFTSTCSFAILSPYISPPSHMPKHGVYFGGGVGVGFTHLAELNNQPALPPGSQINNGTTTYSVSETVNSVARTEGFAWNTNAGYLFNPHFALQVDYFGFNRGTANTTSVLTPVPAGASTTVPGSALLRSYAVDLVGKGIFAAGNTGIYFYGKGGLGLLGLTSRNSVLPSTNTIVYKNTSLMPTLGLGALYYIGNNLTVDVNWSHFFGKNASYAMQKIPPADFIGVMLDYYIRYK